jgi:hypothetical protein
MRVAALASQGGHVESQVPAWWRPYYPEATNWHVCTVVADDGIRAFDVDPAPVKVRFTAV